VSTNLLPPPLSQIQFVDYRKQDRDAVLRLARALSAVPPSTPLPNPLPSSPEAPISYLGSLAEQVETTSALTYEEQSALLVDLKRSLQDANTTKDTQVLLETLRKRRDLFATIAEEIDQLLAGIKKMASVPPRALKPEPPSQQSSPAATSIKPSPGMTQPEQDNLQFPSPSPKETPHTLRKRKRRWGISILIALLSIFVGYGIGWLTFEATRINSLAWAGWIVISIAGIVLALITWRGKKSG
jgi:hypothetical protein